MCTYVLRSRPASVKARFDEAAAEQYGALRAALETSGTPLGALDMMIAAHAVSQGATLVSNDAGHFDRVEGLLVADRV